MIRGAILSQLFWGSNFFCSIFLRTWAPLSLLSIYNTPLHLIDYNFFVLFSNFKILFLNNHTIVFSTQVDVDYIIHFEVFFINLGEKILYNFFLVHTFCDIFFYLWAGTTSYTSCCGRVNVGLFGMFCFPKGKYLS